MTNLFTFEADTSPDAEDGEGHMLRNGERVARIYWCTGSNAGWYLEQAGYRDVFLADLEVSPEGAQAEAAKRLLWLARNAAFPTKTSIERVPHSYAERSYSKPVWRLTTWAKRDFGDIPYIQDVVESDKLSVVLGWTTWRVTPFVKVIEEALRALGRAKVEGTRATCKSDGPEWAFRIYENSIRIQRKRGPEPDNYDNNEVQQWNPLTKQWEVVL